MFAFISFICTEQFRIHLAKTDKFIAGDLTKQSPLHLVDFEDGTTFSFRSDNVLSEKVYITVYNHPNISLVIEKNKNTLVFGPFLRSLDNLFSFVPLNFHEKTFWITNRDKCLTWDEANIFFYMKECDLNNEKQQFKTLHITIEELNLVMSGSIVSSYEEKRSRMIEKVTYSHYMENEGEKLLGTIYNILDNLDICFDKTNVCSFSYDYIDALYKEHGYKGYAESYKYTYSGGTN